MHSKEYAWMPLPVFGPPPFAKQSHGCDFSEMVLLARGDKDHVTYVTTVFCRNIETAETFWYEWPEVDDEPDDILAWKHILPFNALNN